MGELTEMMELQPYYYALLICICKRKSAKEALLAMGIAVKD